MFLSQYAAKNKIDHPRAVYLREDQVLPSLDAWLAQVCHPDALPQTLPDLDEAQHDGVVDVVAEHARREIAACDAKLRQHRAALEAGADATIVTGWMAETQAQRAVAEARLRIGSGSQRQRLSREQIESLVSSMGDLVAVLADADPADRAEIYTKLGLALTYHPGQRKVAVKVKPLAAMYVRKCPRGDLNTGCREISLEWEIMRITLLLSDPS